MNLRQVTDQIAVAAQPTPEDLSALAADGYRAVLNLRHDGEPDQPLSVAAEGELVRSNGMAYLSYPVGGAPLDRQRVEQACAFIDQHSNNDQKVVIHCRKGGRAVALVLLYIAAAESWPADEVLTRGQALGLAIDGNLRTLVEQYLAESR